MPIYPIEYFVFWQVCSTPGFPCAPTALVAGGQLTEVPNPGPLFHSGVENDRYCVKMNVSPELSALCIGTMAAFGNFDARAELMALIAGSFHLAIFPS